MRCVISEINSIYEVQDVAMIAFKDGYVICRDHYTSAWNFDNTQICIRKINAEIYELHTYQGNVSICNNVIHIYSPRVQIFKDDILVSGIKNPEHKYKEDSIIYNSYIDCRCNIIKSKNYMLDFIKSI